MGPIGAQEMFLIVLIALLLFGPKKLPELGRMLGKGLTEFRRAKNELKSTFESHMRELERETRLNEETDKPKWETTSSYSDSYPYNYTEYGTSEPYSTPAGESTETPSLPPASEPVSGTVPRSSSPAAPEPVSARHDEDHTA
jgi:TatA/E family protein of Tat protein translocase